MSEFDAILYQKMLAKVQRQVQTLRVMLETLEVRVGGWWGRGGGANRMTA